MASYGRPRLPFGNKSYSYFMPLPSVFQGVQHVPAICFSGRSRLPFARPQTVQTLPKAFKATTLTATSCPCHLYFRGSKTAVSSPKATHRWFLMGVQACRLPALQPKLKTLKTLKKLKTLKTLTWQPSPKANDGFLWASKPAVCQPLNPPNPPNPPSPPNPQTLKKLKTLTWQPSPKANAPNPCKP